MAKKARKRVSPYKPVQRKTTVGAAVADAFSEIDTLRDEMDDNATGMEGTGLENTQKYQDTCDARDTLANNKEEPDVPESLADLEVTYTEMVPRRKSRSPSRDTRLSNAMAMLSGAIDALEGHEPDDSDPDNDADSGDVDALKESLQGTVDELDGNVTFPGMYG